MSIHTLEKNLNYRFKSIDLIKLALIHKSSNNNLNNERLEFLGDSILNSVISEYLYLKYPNEKEGLLTLMRSYIVKGDALTKKAHEIELLKFIELSKGTANLLESRKQSILEGTIESIIGAVFIDGGFEEAQNFVLNLFKNELKSIGPDQEFRDSKTELQELLQFQKKELPKYISKSCNDFFECQIQIDEKYFSGKGISKRQAEISVAKSALSYLKSKNV